MPAIEITQHCRPEHCIAKLTGDSKEDVISEIIDTFVASGAVGEDAAAELFGEILAREEEGTTGIGMGVAMPHARASNVVDSSLIGVGLHRDGIDFDATDGSPVHMVFLIAAADSEEYLRIAGRIARVARDNVEMKALQRQTTAKSIHRFLEESWSSLNA